MKSSSRRLHVHIIYIRGMGAEPDRIDRRRGPARQLVSHARPGARCYRLYYYTYLSVVVVIVVVFTLYLYVDGRRRTTTTRRGAETFRSANDERAEKRGNKERERGCARTRYSRVDERDKHTHTNSEQNNTHNQEAESKTKPHYSCTRRRKWWRQQ